MIVAAMMHAQLTLATLRVAGRNLALRHADLVVVARAESAQLDWEVVAQTARIELVGRSTHRLELGAVTGVDQDGCLLITELSGAAFLVRSVEDSLVFRGTGDLAGFDVGSLRG